MFLSIYINLLLQLLQSDSKQCVQLVVITDWCSFIEFIYLQSVFSIYCPNRIIYNTKEVMSLTSVVCTLVCLFCVCDVTASMFIPRRNRFRSNAVDPIVSMFLMFSFCPYDIPRKKINFIKYLFTFMRLALYVP